MDAAEARKVLDKADRVKVFVETELLHTGDPTDLVNINDLWCLYRRWNSRSPMSEARFVAHLAQVLRYDVYEDPTRPDEALLVGWAASPYSPYHGRQRSAPPPRRSASRPVELRRAAARL